MFIATIYQVFANPWKVFTLVVIAGSFSQSVFTYYTDKQVVTEQFLLEKQKKVFYRKRKT